MTNNNIKQITADEFVEEMIKAQKAATKHLMMTVSKLPWTREAVVAGGAPRDWYCNRPASDIDVFLIGTTITRRQLELDMKQAGFEIKPANQKDRYSDPDYGYGNPALKWVYDGVIEWRLSVAERSRPIKFQIIVTTFPDLAALIGSFAVEISKFTFDHITGQIAGHGGAIKDMTEKTVTQTSIDYKRGKAYVKKICAKFPDHRFVDAMPPSSPVNVGTVKLAAKHPPTKPVSMTSEQFVFWLQGFFEMTNSRTISEQQTTMIRDHLALVFDKVTPYRGAEVEIAQPNPVIDGPTSPVVWPPKDQQPRPAIEVTWRDNSNDRQHNDTQYTGHSLTSGGSFSSVNFGGERADATPNSIIPAKTHLS